jgi:hypothetical protein
MENTATQQEQREQEEMYWRQQRERYAREQYEMQRRNAIYQMQQNLREVNAFETLRLLHQYGLYTLPLSYEQKLFLNRKLFQIFNDPNSELTSIDWKTLLNTLNSALASTNRMQINRMGAGGNYNQYGNPYGSGGWGNYGNYPPPGGNYYSGPGYPGGYYDPPPFHRAPKDDPTEPESEEVLIAKYKKYFLDLLYQVDPIIFIISLISSGYEIDKENDEFEGTLKYAISGAIPFLDQQAMQIVYQTIDILLRSKYNSYRGERQNSGYPDNGYGAYPGAGGYPPGGNYYPGSGPSYGPPPNDYGYGGYPPPGGNFGPPPGGGYPGAGYPPGGPNYGPPPNSYGYGSYPPPGGNFGPPPPNNFAYGPPPNPSFNSGGRGPDFAAIW